MSTNNSEHLDPTKSHDGKPPVDPSNTSHIGQKVDQGIISPAEGLNKQASKWEDETDEQDAESLLKPEADKYIKHPSPEDNSTE